MENLLEIIGEKYYQYYDIWTKEIPEWAYDGFSNSLGFEKETHEFEISILKAFHNIAVLFENLAIDKKSNKLDKRDWDWFLNQPSRNQLYVSQYFSDINDPWRNENLITRIDLNELPVVARLFFNKDYLLFIIRDTLTDKNRFIKYQFDDKQYYNTSIQNGIHYQKFIDDHLSSVTPIKNAVLADFYEDCITQILKFL